MQTLLDSTNPFFAWLWRASWQASVMIVLVLAAQWLLRNQLSPRWRHALWLLVVVRLALPWSPESPVSLFNWLRPALPSALSGPSAQLPASTAVPESPALDQSSVAAFPASVSPAHSPWWMWLPVVWLAGVVAIAVWLLADGFRLGLVVRRQRPLIDASVLNLLEDCKQEMGVRTPLTLVETPAVHSPSLFGFIRPRLLLPAGLTSHFSLAELRYVFLHEVGHLKRGDIPINWLATAPLILHWFNPFVWLALSRMRADGELACDALALSHTRETENKPYGQAIIKLLESFTRPAVAPGLVGILENQNQMKRRISMIARFKKTNQWPLVAVALFAALGLVTLTDAQMGQGTAGGTPGGAPVGGVDPNTGLPPAGPPEIVSTSPTVGQTDVDPALTEVTVTFDRDMAGGYSWTGGGPDYPPGREGQKVQWRNRRTCVLPVTLEAGRYYRVGINSKSYQNFRSAAGSPARPSAIYFTTQGASDELKQKTLKPVIVRLEPLYGAQDVDPNLTELRVTFNVPMGGGFSWTGGGPDFPTIPEGKKPFWTDDRMTCVLPVELKPGWTYSLGLNSPSHNNFQSAGGVPLDPVAYTFTTRN